MALSLETADLPQRRDSQSSCTAHPMEVTCAIGISTPSTQPTSVEGTGFFVSDGRRVLTARHVVRKAELNSELAVWIATGDAEGSEGPTYTWWKAEVDRSLLGIVPRGVDAAVIDLPSGLKPQSILELNQVPIQCYGEIGGFGYPRRESLGGNPKWEPLPPARMSGEVFPWGGKISYIRLTLQEVRHPDPITREWFDSQIAPLLQGFSGAPVLDVNSGRVVGLVAHTWWSPAIAVDNVSIAALSMTGISVSAPTLWNKILPWFEPRRISTSKSDDAVRDRSKLVIRDLNEVTIRRVDRELERQLGGDELLDGEGKDPKQISQRQLLTKLERFCRSKSKSDKVRVVVGPRGIGKSTVLWWLARELAKSYLRNQYGPIPLLMDVRRLDVKPSEIRSVVSAKALWDLLMTAWAQYADAVRDRLIAAHGYEPYIAPTDSSLEQLRAALASEQVIVLLDGIDDMMSYYQIEPAQVRAVIENITSTTSEDGFPIRRCIVMLRDNLHEDLGYSPNRGRLDLAAMNVSQQRDFLGAKLFDHLCAVTNYSPERFPFRTPFELRPLRTLADGNLAIRPEATSRAGLREYALRRTFAVSPSTLPPGLSSADEVLDALTIIGFAAYRIRFDGRGYGEAFDLGVLRDELKTLSDSWASGIESSKHSLSMAFVALTGDRNCLDQLLRLDEQKIFSPLADGRWHFTHGLWLDFTVGRFLAHAIAANRLRALGETTFYSYIFETAAQLLQSMDEYGQLTARMANSLIDALKEAKDKSQEEMLRRCEFCIGAVLLAYGVETALIEPAALSVLNHRFEHLTPLAQHVMLGIFAARFVRRSPGDPSRAGIGELLRSISRRKLADQSANVVTRSLAWMISAVVSPANANDLPAWPSLSAKDIDQAVALACPENAGEPQSRRRLATLQAGYIDTVMTLPARPHSVVGAVHYLFLCVCIHMSGLGFRRLDNELRKLFGGPIAAKKTKINDDVRKVVVAFSDQQKLPPLKLLLKAAEHIYLGRHLTKFLPQ